MALVSGQWIEQEVKGSPPSARHGHATAVVGDIAFTFGGCSMEDGEAILYNDLHMLVVTPTELSWEEVPHSGHLPCARFGHSLCAVRGALYLFGGQASLVASEALIGVFRFHLDSLSWEKVCGGGLAPRALCPAVAALGDDIYVMGGVRGGQACNDVFQFNTVSLTWTPVHTFGVAPSPRCDHGMTAVGTLLYVFGGIGGSDKVSYSDVHVLDTATLSWSACEVRGEPPCGRGCHSLTSHHDKDIYVFGGTRGTDGTSLGDLHKLSLAKMKWKVPLYMGLAPEQRHSHTVFILHGHLYVFGGINEQRECNDVKAMRLINPSDRQPLMKEILSEMGLQEINTSFIPTRIPRVKYELSEPPKQASTDSSPTPPGSCPPEPPFPELRAEAAQGIRKALDALDVRHRRLNAERAELTQGRLVLQEEKALYAVTYRRQQEELQEMLERHRSQNEAWLKARAAENDAERRQLCIVKDDLVVQQAQLREQEAALNKRALQLSAIMQQFKGM